ncbi:hypothetical protein BO99DRAFT_82905 [Aspergillus violaceofuscus CBS 115571]|uniref:Uncharacterized protein n=1 Tax=Aspergillus violaceofuscus (strain CBS 115571) TaxID=1450538 RepID=A0A2V5IN50_ASPV1|nr:hypothetical protein BO99DRAFT_82905 [Aspergillus violaceofuscus CBS 115571]
MTSSLPHPVSVCTVLGGDYATDYDDDDDDDDDDDQRLSSTLTWMASLSTMHQLTATVEHKQAWTAAMVSIVMIDRASVAFVILGQGFSSRILVRQRRDSLTGADGGRPTSRVFQEVGWRDAVGRPLSLPIRKEVAELSFSAVTHVVFMAWIGMWKVCR